MDPVVLTGTFDIETDFDWTKEPVFQFETEVEALMTVQQLGEEIAATREQLKHLMRYMAAAARAARHNGEGDTQPQAIINHSGLARQTVYNMLGEDND